MFHRLGLLMYLGRWGVLSAWVALLVLAAFFAPRAPGVLKNDTFSAHAADSIQVTNALVERFGSGRTYLVPVFTLPEGASANDEEWAKKVDDAIADLRKDKDVLHVHTAASTGSADFVSANGRYTYALVGLNVDANNVSKRLAHFQSLIRPNGLDIKVTGTPVVLEAVARTSMDDVRRAELYTFPLALLILLFVFRTVVAAAMPLMMAAASTAVTLLGLYFLGQVTDLSVFVLNVSSMLALGVGIDYSLFIVSRYREELYKQNGDRGAAIATTLSTAGQAVFVSGLTVMIGMGSLLLFRFPMMRSIGIGGMLVVAVSVLAAVTLLPAVLGLLGQKVNALKVPGLAPVEKKLADVGGHGFWHALSTAVSKHPVLIAVAVLALLATLGSPAIRLNLGGPTFRSLPEGEPARAAAEILDQEFPLHGSDSDLFVLVLTKDGSDMTESKNVDALFDYVTNVKKEFPEVDKVLVGQQDMLMLPREQAHAFLEDFRKDPASLDPKLKRFLSSFVNKDAATVRFLTHVPYSTPEGTKFIHRVRAHQPANLMVKIGGRQAELVDFASALYGDFPVAIAFVVVMTYLTLLVMFRSVLLPLKAIIMTTLSLSAAYGALVWIFQEGHFKDVFNVQEFGYVETTLPILLFAILFGLSMDYEVLMLSRIKELYEKSGDNTASVAQGLERTGGLITSAALVMVVVAGAFATAQETVVKAVGVGMALVVALDATVVRALLVPSTMELLGKANWWAPKFLKRLLPELHLDH
ncbi:MAG: MMPL family transporter [Myxococcaceae bacterium]